MTVRKSIKIFFELKIFKYPNFYLNQKDIKIN